MTEDKVFLASEAWRDQKVRKNYKRGWRVRELIQHILKVISLKLFSDAISFRWKLYHARCVDVFVKDHCMDWLFTDPLGISETMSDEKQLERNSLGNQYGGLTLLRLVRFHWRRSRSRNQKRRVIRSSENLELVCRRRTEEEAEDKPITRFDSGPCDWLVLPLLLPTPTI